MKLFIVLICAAIGCIVGVILTGWNGQGFNPMQLIAGAVGLILGGFASLSLFGPSE